MTPKEFDFMFQVIEELARRAYHLGYEDGKAGNPLKEEGFSLSKGNRLSIKTNLQKYTRKR